MNTHTDVPPYYLPVRTQCVFVRYYTFQVQAGKSVPVWIYDKYVLPFIQQVLIMRCLSGGEVTDTPIELCSGYVLLQPDDVAMLQSFDSELFNTVVGILLLSFFAGHALGRLVRWLGK